jgi:hypothetical protein
VLRFQLSHIFRPGETQRIQFFFAFGREGLLQASLSANPFGQGRILRPASRHAGVPILPDVRNEFLVTYGPGIRQGFKRDEWGELNLSASKFLNFYLISKPPFLSHCAEKQFIIGYPRKGLPFRGN